MYELLVLKLPFEGEGSAAAGGANMKGHILSGGRPHLTEKVNKLMVNVICSFLSPFCLYRYAVV